jgi:nucleoside 2-deoxyribosyltransferase
MNWERNCIGQMLYSLMQIGSSMKFQSLKFVLDELQSCDAIVACLDQFPIDSGVACEIGVAFGSNIPVIGLYTDIRSRRKGAGRMYKNQYVLGAIEANGEVVYSIEQLLKILPKYT